MLMQRPSDWLFRLSTTFWTSRLILPNLGKTAGKDSADNKPTYVSLLGLEESRQLAEKLRNDAYAALSIFDEKADYLRQLADLVVRRKK